MSDNAQRAPCTVPPLVRCWRCGHTASVKGYEMAWFIRCDNRHCNAESHPFTRPAYAARWWNRRAPNHMMSDQSQSKGELT
jgi:hypothetical protein